MSKQTPRTLVPPTTRQQRRFGCFLSLVALIANGAAAQAPAQPEPRQPETTPIPVRNRPISLEEAIQIAFQYQGSIAVAEESVEAARQRVRQARTGVLPNVLGSVGYGGAGTSNLGGLFGPEPTVSAPGPGGAPATTRLNTDSATFNRGLQPRIGLNYTVYDGGLTRTQVRQARANVEGSQASLVTTRNNLTFTVTSNYLFQLRSERLLELRVTQERLALEQLNRVEAQVRQGKAAAADRALVLSEYQNRRVDRISAQNDAQVSANTLRNTMGLSVGPVLQLVERRDTEELLPSLETMQDLARRQRPEVVQAEAQVRVSQAGVSIARIRRKPRLTTSFVFNVSTNNQFQRSDYNVAAAVSLPLWDAGLTHAQEAEARTGVQSSSANLEQTRKDVEADVVEAYLNLVNARARLEASRVAVQAAQVNLEQTTARYEVGAPNATVLELITAQVQFANANNGAISALYDVYLAQAQLHRAIGR